MRDHLSDLLHARATSDGPRPFLCTRDSVLSFAACDELVSLLAGRLRAAGCAPGQFVGVWCTNRPEFVISYFAVLRAGGIAVPLNPKLAPEELRYMIGDADMALVLHPPELPCALPCAPVCECVRDGITVVCAKTDQALRGRRPVFPATLDDIAVCIYTSGTTGRPKGALLSHAALAANARMCALGLQSRDRAECFVTILPLFHAFAASACMLHAVVSGARLLLVEQFQPQELLRLMAQHQATVFMGVPAMYAVLAALEDPPPVPSWRLCISGGAPMPLTVFDQFLQRYGLPIHEGDGPTECGPATSINPVGGVVKTGTIGVPLSRVEMRIVDDDMREIPRGEIGEIVVRSPANFSAYLNQPDETARTLVDGWVRTGDLGTCDSDGYFAIVDRKKDMLIVAGLNVYPREVEEYIRQHPSVADVAVIGMDDAVRGEVPAACIVPRPGAALELAELRQFLRPRIAAYKIPRRLHVLDALPRNATGKVLKTALRALLANTTVK